MSCRVRLFNVHGIQIGSKGKIDTEKDIINLELTYKLDLKFYSSRNLWQLRSLSPWSPSLEPGPDAQLCLQSAYGSVVFTSALWF